MPTRTLFLPKLSRAVVRLICFFLIFIASALQVNIAYAEQKPDTQPHNTLLILGDSLSAGYQMQPAESWPALLQTTLQQHNSTSISTIHIVNASISGSTSEQGLAQLPDLLTEHQPRWVLIALGANDGLRGQPLDRLENALSEIITRSQAQQATPILMQIQIPPNYGSRYSQIFAAIYPRLAEHFAVPLLPFFMENVISKPEWLMADGLHPNSTAQPFIAQMLYTQLLPILDSSPKP